MPSPTAMRADFPYFHPIQTRWHDNDIYGHVNNVVYYAYFDTAVNMFMVENGGFDPHSATVIGIVPETHCNFWKPVAYPDKLEAGLRISKLGNSSVRYEIGIFIDGDDDPSATGHFVHVFVGRQTMRPVPIPAPIRAAMETICSGPPAETG
ncbi:MAG: thioesterase family protein [Rhodospirillaceae bacterium]